MSKEKQIDYKEFARQMRQVATVFNGTEPAVVCSKELWESIASAIESFAGYRKQSEGHWFILEYEYFTCSECGYYHPNGCDSTKEAKEKLADGKVPSYCSECGAKMKGGE